MSKKLQTFKYFEHLLPLFLFELISKIVLFIILRFSHLFSGLILRTINRTAFTSGDLPYLLRSWQGILILIIAVAVLLLYFAIDINTTILISKNIIHNEKIILSSVIKKSFNSLKKLFSPLGFLIVVYVTFISPLLLGFFSISLTSSFKIPDFILSVIKSNTVLRILYYGFLLFLLVYGIIHIFLFHYINLKGYKPKKALKESGKLFINNFKQFVKSFLPIFLFLCILFALIVAVIGVAPIVIINLLNLPKKITRFFLVFFVILAVVIIGFAYILFSSFTLLKLTVLFEKFNKTDLPEIKKSTKKHRFIVATCITICVLIVAASFVLTANFNKFFPKINNPETIAHRGAGVLDNENTVRSIKTAIECKAFASEIDIHRTKDGAYILNHDADFSRLTGVNKTPQEMTLKEIKQLRMKDGTKIATLDEVLDTAKNKIHLFIELKGASADEKMVEDVYNMLSERDMVNQCSFISLQYEVLEYTEKTHPDIDTIYLLFFGFGDIENLVCDGFGLESECATFENIDYIHDAGKHAEIWTCNDSTAILNAFFNNADGIITDQLFLTEIIKKIITYSSDIERIFRFIVPEL